MMEMSFTNDRNLKVRITTEGIETQAKSYRLSINSTNWGDWIDFGSGESIAETTFTLGSNTPSEQKTVYLQIRYGDSTIFGPFRDTINYDNVSPSVSVLIDSGNEFTNNRNVDLDFTYSDDFSGVKSLQTSLDGETWSDWFDAVETKELELAETEGVQTVYVRGER